MTGSAAKKLQKDEQVRTIIGGTVGVPERHFTTLAVLELAGTAGILLGLWLEPLGIAAAIGLTLYFTGALIAHLRVGDTKHLTMPLPPLGLPGARGVTGNGREITRSFPSAPTGCPISLTKRSVEACHPNAGSATRPPVCHRLPASCRGRDRLP